MSSNLVIDENKAVKLYQTLRKHLSYSETGQQVISAFEANPDEEGTTLANYLHQRLPHDRALANQLANALGGGENQFATIVAGGEVEKIVNIARLGVLNLTVKRYFYIFRDVRQVVAFLAIVILTVVAVAYGIWRRSQPDVMTGDFNIAVAEFVQTGESSSDTPVAEMVSQRLASFLDGQYNLSSFEEVVVTHEKIGIITNALEAERLSEKINADIVIYGDVTVLGDQALTAPKFYVVESHRANVGEVSGQHQLAAPISFTFEELTDPSGEVLEELRQRSVILTEFTKALVYLAARDLVLAREAIDNTIEQGNAYGDLEGKEVFYLLASQVARLQGDFQAAMDYLEGALQFNDNYGRAYIARANVYYDQQDFYLAWDYYEQAKQLKDQPFGAYITEKASLGLGNICSTQYQHVVRDDSVNQVTAVELADCALQNYQVVINTYHGQSTPEASLREMIAWAYYGSGIVYQESGQFIAARQVYEQSLNLTEDFNLMERAQRRLNEVQGK